MAWELNGNINTNPPNDFLGTSDNQPLVIKTNATEAVQIAASGNVGVGVATPATPNAKLHVLGPGGGAVVAAIEQPNGMNFMDFRSAQGGGNYGTSLRFIDSGTVSANINSTADGQLRFATNGTERLFIDGSGNVSVGTVGPTSVAKLLVESTGGGGLAGVFIGDVVVAGSILRAENAVKAWASITMDAGTPTIRGGFNVAGVTYSPFGIGLLVNFTQAISRFPSQEYAVALGGGSGPVSSAGTVPIAWYFPINSTQMEVRFYDPRGGAQPLPGTSIRLSLVVCGIDVFFGPV